MDDKRVHITILETTNLRAVAVSRATLPTDHMARRCFGMSMIMIPTKALNLGERIHGHMGIATYTPIVQIFHPGNRT